MQGGALKFRHASLIGHSPASKVGLWPHVASPRRSLCHNRLDRIFQTRLQLDRPQIASKSVKLIAAEPGGCRKHEERTPTFQIYLSQFPLSFPTTTNAMLPKICIKCDYPTNVVEVSRARRPSRFKMSTFNAKNIYCSLPSVQPDITLSPSQYVDYLICLYTNLAVANGLDQCDLFSQHDPSDDHPQSCQVQLRPELWTDNSTFNDGKARRSCVLSLLTNILQLIYPLVLMQTTSMTLNLG